MSDQTQLQCGSCGVIHCIPTAMYESAKKEGGWWHCPNGHVRGWKDGTEKTEIANLRRERDRLNQRVAERDDEITHQRDLREGVERRLNATKGVVTRIKNRVGHGVCPCCTRTFGNLAKHMATKHADYAKSPVLEAVE